MQQSRSYWFLALVLALTGLSIWGYVGVPYKFGLDVRGGVRFTYSMDTSKVPADTPRAGLQDRVVTMLENRAIGPLGVAEPYIFPKGENQIVVELPGFSNVDEAREVMSTTASLEWYHAKNIVTEKKPWLGKYRPIDGEGTGPVVWFERVSGEGEPIKPGNPEYAKIIEEWELILQGDDLQRAGFQSSGTGYSLTMLFSPEGAKKMETWTRRHQYTGDYIAAVLDGVVLNAAPLKEGAVIKENGIIEGQFSQAYIRQLIELLNSGALPVSLVEESSISVHPTIGEFALEKILLAGGISFGIICLFLLIYYRFPGLMALIALVLYVLFTITVLKLIGATFSLAAIAGFVLSVGMAVDANILVFERLKEELREGKSLHAAMELGFKRALPAIIDSNACTILTSIVLASVGTGPVVGFATTLIIGVSISLFTAVFITRSLLIFIVGSGIGNNPNWYGLNMQWFGEGLEASADAKPLQIIQRRKLYFLISAIVIVPGIIAIALGGIKPNVEFQGGYEALYVSGSTTANEVAQKLEAAGIEGANIKFADSAEGRLMSITAPMGGPLTTDAEASKEALRTATGFPASAERGVTNVGAAVRDETIRGAVLGVVFSTLLIVLYLAFRFGLAVGGGFLNGLRFAGSIVAALLHDVVFVLGVAAIMGLALGWEISALFLSAMLTVIGFSTHDSIVIFDRIRENLRRPLKGEDIGNLIDRSITQSIARSINTSMTVVVTLILLVWFGSATQDLRLFNLTMLAGILVGTYSSIFNAAPILYVWDRWVAKRKGEEHTLLGIAAHNIVRTRITPTAADAVPATGSAQTYGQVRRRASAIDRSRKNVDEE